ncbi:MAG: nucleotidyltransferase [Spirochaetales bacterium]|nr:nucleotidyltransferase [Spirochaetales bacterium]
MFEELIINITSQLKQKHIVFIIIGGQAVLLYGEPRLANDIDIILGKDTDSLSLIIDVCEKLDFDLLVKDNVEKFTRETMVLPCVDKKTGIKVDFIFSFTDFEKNAINRANKIKILNTEVPCASIEDLIIFKIIAGRERDLEDGRIMILKNPGINKETIAIELENFNKMTRMTSYKNWRN